MTTPLAALADVKTFLQISGNGQDSLLDRLITAASAFIESWLSRTIAVATYTKTFNGHGGQALFLPDRPVVAVTAVQIDGQDLSPSTSIYEAGFVYDEYEVALRGYTFYRGFQNVSVTWSAGLASNAPTDVPDDLQQACIELIALKYRRMGEENKKSAHLGTETVSFVVEDMPPAVKTILQQYKNVVPA